MRIAIFGLGYVGMVSAACFADRGHTVVGVDVSADKVDLVSAGKATIYEEAIGELVATTVADGRLTATTDAAEAVAGTDLALVCVGTPSAPGGGLSTRFLEGVARDIGAALPTDRRYTVVIRSTMIPGTCEERIIPALEEASGRKAGVDFGVCVNPEFLREGTSVRDFHDPPKTVIGQYDEASGDLVAQLYEGLPGPVFRVPIRVAEMTKYVDNSFHALKVGFANEIGAVCKSLDIDSHAVMEIFKSDTKLNIAPTYLTPGMSFGGSCLPKDVRAIVHHSRHSDVPVPILQSILPSNEEHLRRAYELVVQSGRRRVGMFGLSFKSGTDDLRESPMAELAERLVGRGFDLRIHDAGVATSQLLGANRAYIDLHIPHLSRLLADDPSDVVEHAEVIIVGTKDPDAIAALGAANGSTIIDLVRFPGSEELIGTPTYHGLCW
ncbi:MAG: nucleotide sugar dehydrogenase [Thermoleophilia bacterium]